MTVIKTVASAVLLAAVLAIAGTFSLLVVGLVLLLVARTNPVLGFVFLVLLAAVWRVATQSKPSGFL